MNSNRPSFRNDLPALLILIALLLVFFPKAATFRGFFFLGDFLQQFYPYLTYSFQRILQSNEWPLWTSQLRLGYPLFAEGQSGLLFPTSWFYLFLDPPAAFNAVVLGNILLGAFGMYGFLRSQDKNENDAHSTLKTAQWMSRSATLIGAVVYAYSGRFLISIIGVSDMRVLGILPWCLWSVYRLFQAPTLGRTAVCAFTVSFLGLAGKPDVAFQAAIILIAAAVFWSRRVQGSGFRVQELEVRGQRSEVRNEQQETTLPHSHTPTLPHSHTPTLPYPLLAFIFACLLALTLSSVQWLPTLELLGQSIREESVPLERWISGSLPPRQILGFLVPWLFGNPYEGTYIGEWSFLYQELYLGPLVGTLILIGSFSRRRKERWLWIGLALLGLLLALGKYLPGYSLLHEIPLFNQGRVPSRWLHLTLVGISILAAYGADALEIIRNQKSEVRGQRSETSNKTPTLPHSHTPTLPYSHTLVVIGMTLALAAFFAFSDPPETFPLYTHGGTKVFSVENREKASQLVTQRHLHWVQAVLLFGLTAGALITAVRYPSFRPWTTKVLLFLIILDQRIHLGDINPTQPASVYLPHSPVIDFLQKQSPGTRFYSYRSHLPAYFLARTRFHRGTEKEILNHFYKHVTPNSALLAGLNDTSGYGELNYAGRPDPDLSPSGLKALASWGVQFVITLKEEIPPGSNIVFQSGEVAIFEIAPLPYLTFREDRVDDAKTQKSILRRESYYPGWVMFIRGKRFNVQRADGMFQGMEWSDGEMMRVQGSGFRVQKRRNIEHRTSNVQRPTEDEYSHTPTLPHSHTPIPHLQFLYDPLSFRMGLAISMFGLSALIAMGVIAIQSEVCRRGKPSTLR